MQSHYTDRLGNAKEADVLDYSLPNSTLRAIRLRSASNTPFFSLPGLMAKPLKTGARWLIGKDKQLRKFQELTVQGPRTNNATANYLVDGVVAVDPAVRAKMLTEVAVRLADDAATKAKLLTDLNNERQKLALPKSTTEAMTVIDTEKLIRNRQRQQLHDQVQQAAEAQSVALDAQVFMQGGGKLRVAVAASLPVDSVIPVAVAAASDGAAWPGRLPSRQTR
jgi:hypothetical protein